MSNEITAQSSNIKGQHLTLGSIEKAKTPARRDSLLKKTMMSGVNSANLASAKKQAAADRENIKEMAKETVDFFNEFVKELQVDLRYEVDDKTNEVVIKFFEKGTDKLIKQVPPEAILHLKQRINDLLGIIYDETV